VPDGELMNASAQNALLKTLEEPPSYTTIIILTSNIDAFLPTIISRCIVFPIKPVRDDLIMKFLMEKKQIVDYKARLAVSFAQGNIGKAIMLTENEDFERLKDASLDLINKMDRLQINEAADRLQAILAGAESTDNETPESDDEESKGGKSTKKADLSTINNFLDILMFFIRDVLVFKAEESADHLIFADKLSYISSVTKKYTYSELNNILKAIDEARSRIKSNVNSLLTLEMLLLKIRDSKENL
jgi:DNA polymerase-3 subunit delta'